MIEKTATTSIGAVEVEVIYSEWESTDEFKSHVEGTGRDGDEAVKDNLNSTQRQNSFQVPKGEARETLEKFGPDSDEFSDALATFKVKVANYRLGSVRKVGDGVKQKESQAATRKLKGDTAHLDDADTITIGQLREMFGDEGVPIN